jgi:glyceraldehyde-3-phosphate dehydrogenase (NADP+)
MRIYDIYLAGQFVKSTNKLPVRNKYSGEVYAETWLADAMQLDEAIVKGLQVMGELASLPAYHKYKSLRFIADALLGERQRLAEVLSTESGKPMKYALGEIERAAQTFLIAAEECKRLPGEYLSLDWTEAGKNRAGLVRYFPAGLVAGISPFNFPMNLAVHKIAPAIAAGCPIILKPASATPLSTLELAGILHAAELQAGAVSILPMNRKIGNQLVTDERIQVLSFTGSPAIGWELKKQCGRKKIVLELGGNAGVIISEGTELKNILTKCLAGAFVYSGQICIHAQRFFIHASLYEKFCEQMVAAATKLIAGDPLLDTTQVSHLIDEDNALRVESWVNEALDAGARLLCGGKKTGSFYSPTILTDTEAFMKVRAEEIFGPVITIEKYEGPISVAVEKINEGRFGLQCGVFTDSVKELDYCFEHIQAGGIIHNDSPLLRFDHMPYGGVKESGEGREGVKYAMRDLLEARILVK